MDALLEQARDIWEGQIDFEGQKLAELITNGILAITGCIAFFAGWATQNIYNTLYVGLGGTALAFVLVVPQWPFYNMNPATFLPPKTGRGSYEIEVDGKKIT